MKPIHLPAGILLVFLAFALFLVSCQKDPYSIGYSILPSSDTLTTRTTDTITVQAFSVLQDSIRSDESATNMLGCVVDPVFGKTIANFCSQFYLSSDKIDFGTDPILDSVVLMLRYNSLYGETNTLQHVKVYELNEDIYRDSAYYSNRSVSYFPTLLGEKTFRPNLVDSVPLYGTKVLPHLRINLNQYSNYFGNKLLYAPEEALLNSNNFVKFMKGLYIESSPVAADGALISFNMTSSLTSLAVFFKSHDSTGKLVDSLIYEFVISAKGARINTFNHENYKDANPEFINQVVNHDSADGKNKLYLQGLGGVKIKIKLPYIKELSKSRDVVLNNAVLKLTNIMSDNSLAPPAKLTLIKSDSTGKIGFLVDENEGSAYFGSSYRASDKSYNFRITRHLQQVLQGKIPNYDLYLLVNDPSSNVLIPNRVVGGGTAPSLPNLESAKFKLEVVYTKLN